MQGQILCMGERVCGDVGLTRDGTAIVFACMPGIYLPLHMTTSPNNALGTYRITTVCDLTRTVNQSILRSPDQSRIGYVICKASCSKIIMNVNMATAGS